MSMFRKLLLAGSVVAAGVSAPASGLAQQTVPTPVPPQESTGEEEIVVTGSRIKRDPTNAPTPLIQIGQEQLLLSGEANVIDYLADIPALQNSTVPEDTTGAGLGDGGLSLLNLRNLGSQRTLVLVDGRRHVGAAYFAATAVDVDTIPRLLIENVEVITGAASATYGGDAVSGVVNFVTKNDYEGFDIDVAYAQINEGDQFNGRVSALAGRNFLDDRLNVYVSAEYEKSDAVLDFDLDWQTAGQILIQNDLDAAATTPDGVLDVIGVSGRGSLNRPLSGSFTLAHGTQPSPAADPDIPFAACGTNFDANCFVLDPPFTSTFGNTGVARPLNFGTNRVPAGLNRTITQGGDSRSFATGQSARLPETESYRFQSGATLEVTPNFEAFLEGKWVQETSQDGFQPAFFDVLVRPKALNAAQTFSALNVFDISLDNAYLDPALRAAVLANMRTTYNAAGAVVGAPVLDQRARLQTFEFGLGDRRQELIRNTQRYVGGFRGDVEQFAFFKDVSWELGYTYGLAKDKNKEADTVDAERWAYGADAVVDTAGIVNGTPGQIVCRIQLQAATFGSITVPTLGVTYTSSSDPVRLCVPFRAFGEGGQTAASKKYILLDQSRGFKIEQHDALGFVSGSIPSPLPYGDIGFAFGGEWRQERYEGAFNVPPGRVLLFANTLLSQPKADYDVTEYFAEVEVPLLADFPLVEELRVSGQYRASNYATVNLVDAFSVLSTWKINDQLMLRGTYGTSVRPPQLNELYAATGQTFLQINDNCSSTIINTTADATLRGRRIANCAALGIPTTYVDPNPGTSNGGFNGANPTLQEEESTSHTISIVAQPDRLPGFSFVVDYYSIDIRNAIATLTVQALLNACVDGASLNAAACSAITRDPSTFEIINFFSGPVNYALQRARGIDFAAQQHIDLADIFEADIGTLDIGLRGSYNIKRQSFTDPVNPLVYINTDASVENPRVRFLLTTAYKKDGLTLTWDWDWQSSQELFDEVVLANDPDNRSRDLLETDDFSQHDFGLTYDFGDEAFQFRAGVVNAFDEEPNIQIANAPTDNFDLFGRRFYVGLRYRH
jgi:outer membrane receptor protein involved in Fe transport